MDTVPVSEITNCQYCKSENTERVSRDNDNEISENGRVTQLWECRDCGETWVIEFVAAMIFVDETEEFTLNSTKLVRL